MPQTQLTVIVPVFNEVATVARLLAAVQSAHYEKQILVVDDGSTDGTGELLDALQRDSDEPFELLRHPRNRGKVAAIRTALPHATGQVTLIQDADLEYHPADYPKLIEPILAGKAHVVYGSRYLGGNELPWKPNRLCVHLLNVMVFALYGQRITDEATCYKAFRTEILRRANLVCERFEFCPEITAKVSRMGYRIHEVPARFDYRTPAEGKKIGWRDGIEAIATLLRWRVAPFRARVGSGRTDP